MEGKDCLICIETYTTQTGLLCGHFICNECCNKLKELNTYRIKPKECPFCFKRMVRKCKYRI